MVKRIERDHLASRYLNLEISKIFHPYINQYYMGDKTEARVHAHGTGLWTNSPRGRGGGVMGEGNMICNVNLVCMLKTFYQTK